MLRKKNSTFGWTSTQRVLRYLWAHGDTLKAQTDIEVTSSPFLYSGSPVLKQSRHDQRRGGEIRWLNCSLTIRPSLKRTLRNPAKVAKRRRGLKKGMKEEGSKTPTEWEGERERARLLRTRQGKKEQKAIYNTVQCCSAPLSGMEGRAGTMGFCPRGEGQPLQRSPPFQPICLWVPHRMLLLPWPHAQHLDT